MAEGSGGSASGSSRGVLTSRNERGVVGSLRSLTGIGYKDKCVWTVWK